MARPLNIHKGKRPYRLHYIVEWARHRHKRQTDFVRELGVDKATVSRWFSGALPSETHLVALSAFLHADEPAALFRHPDDDWLSRFFQNRSDEERKRIKETMMMAFPPKTDEAA